ncbi:MAG: hypothetical protein VXW22_16250 [Pseudomonadota bacterium]|nr:hypothetical protein [Pseudomonadota bacterium]
MLNRPTTHTVMSEEEYLEWFQSFSTQSFMAAITKYADVLEEQAKAVFWNNPHMDDPKKIAMLREIEVAKAAFCRELTEPDYEQYRMLMGAPVDQTETPTEG